MSDKVTKKQSNSRIGLALALSCFILSVFLYFQPQTFGRANSVISIVLIFVGFIGLATEFNTLSSGQRSLADDFQAGAGIFDNFGYGVAILILWIALSYYFPAWWFRAAISIIFFFGIVPHLT